MDEEKTDNPKPESRFPDIPQMPDLPPAPKLESRLPPRADPPKPGGLDSDSFNKTAIAATAATSFVMPIVLFSVGGWWLDNRMHHQVAWLAFIGVLVGMITGVMSLLKVISRLNS